MFEFNPPTPPTTPELIAQAELMGSKYFKGGKYYLYKNGRLDVLTDAIIEKILMPNLLRAFERGSDILWGWGEKYIRNGCHWLIEQEWCDILRLGMEDHSGENGFDQFGINDSYLQIEDFTSMLHYVDICEDELFISPHWRPNEECYLNRVSSSFIICFMDNIVGETVEKCEWQLKDTVATGRHKKLITLIIAIHNWLRWGKFRYKYRVLFDLYDKLYIKYILTTQTILTDDLSCEVIKKL
jgi:hypothetical protein